MALLIFEGPAGTGKTTRTLAASRERVGTVPLEDDQRVLGLTKHHGSRRRMELALKGSAGVGPCVDCLTIDSFAWQLVRRWRTLARDLGLKIREGDFQAISSAAALILRQPGVGRWVARKYPLLVVDEMQDCKGGEVELLSSLAPYLHCICAADAFQDLSGDAENEAIAWAESVGETVRLDYSHRTQVEGLLAAANALRTGRPLRSERANGFEIVSAPRAAAGGGSVSWRIRLWRGSDEIAVVSPTGPGTSPFVKDLLAWVGTKKAKSKKPGVTAGPFTIEWETSEGEHCSRLKAMMELPDDPEAPVSCSNMIDIARRTKARDVMDWVRKQENVGGRSVLSAGELAENIDRIIHLRRAYGHRRERKRFALTAHQAKNREFESVIVLWPMRIQPDPEQQRRLLYNAITRAKQQVLVVVEDPKRKRLRESPFAGC